MAIFAAADPRHADRLEVAGRAAGQRAIGRELALSEATVKTYLLHV